MEPSEPVAPVLERAFVHGLHLLLEMAALVAIGYWGWTTHDGVQRWAWAVALPLLLATIWAVFRVSGDGGDPIIEIPGVVRLILEVAILGGAAALLQASGQETWAILFVVLIVIDFGLQRDRIGRLLAGRLPG